MLFQETKFVPNLRHIPNKYTNKSGSTTEIITNPGFCSYIINGLAATEIAETNNTNGSKAQSGRPTG